MMPEGEKKTKCPYCGKTVRAGNFCSKCSKKMVRVCDCWVLGNRHDCGKEVCPGKRLHLEMVRQAKGGENVETKKPRWAELFRDVLIIGGAVLIGERLAWLLFQ